MSHQPNKGWSLKINTNGMEFYISGIPFQDIAIACGEGIRQHIKDAQVKVFFAKAPEQEPPVVP